MMSFMDTWLLLIYFRIVNKTQTWEKWNYLQFIASKTTQISNYFTNIESSFNDQTKAKWDNSVSDLTIFHYDVKLSDEGILSSKILSRNINVIHQLYHVMPAFLTSFKFADYSPNVFLNQVIEVYKNMPNNYGILEYFVNQKYQFKVEIDEHLDFTKEDIFYERLIIVNSKVFNIRTVGLKEFINEINSVQLQDIESSRNEARISELSYFILSKVLIHDEQEVLNLFDNWTQIISIDKFILE